MIKFKLNVTREFTTVMAVTIAFTLQGQALQHPILRQYYRRSQSSVHRLQQLRRGQEHLVGKDEAGIQGQL